ncbi:ring canal kelch homolog isoform X3 [Acyrthosiphon pisum]|uniref:Kelch-like protein diablo n=1 Tax=Acyrthosiphon pisum TaxID=7029 RepID=A0A8R2JVZ5_ACYPI|nr:ring canal kelch homolog isoform X3 [Acyrthosiphon pisum]
MENTKQIPESRRCESAKYKYKKSSHVEIFKVLQSLRWDEMFCDFKLETDDGKIICGHKVILASASPYFHAMFKNCEEKNQYLVIMKQLDSTALQLLVNFIYSGEITVTENNLQLQEVKEACCHFLQTQMCPKNCIAINALADLHSCTKLLRSSELYILQHFSDMVEGDEFLSLSSEQMVKLIACDELKVPSEEKVFESVIRWIKYDLDSRKGILPQLMEHVRLPLTSKDYILKKIVEEPLVNNCLKSKDYVIEALHFHLLKSNELVSFLTIPHHNRKKPRQPGSQKVILAVGGSRHGGNLDSTEWYDPKINQWQPGPQMIASRFSGGLAVVKDNFVIYMGGVNLGSVHQSVYLLDLSSESPYWKSTVDMLIKRRHLGVGVINNYLYAVGGSDGNSCLSSAEVFDCRTQEWRMISSMATRRSSAGIGVLHNLLFVVGGVDGLSKLRLNSVECYHPSLDKWTPVSKMRVRRSALGVGVLDDVVYAVGGTNGFKVHKSVEAYSLSTGVWTSIPDMHLCRQFPGVAVLDGLLYVVGGDDGTSTFDSVEFYNPKTKTWTMVTTSCNDARTAAGVVAIDRPRNFKTC